MVLPVIVSFLCDSSETRQKQFKQAISFFAFLHFIYSRSCFVFFPSHAIIMFFAQVGIILHRDAVRIRTK